MDKFMSIVNQYFDRYGREVVYCEQTALDWMFGRITGKQAREIYASYKLTSEEIDTIERRVYSEADI